MFKKQHNESTMSQVNKAFEARDKKADKKAGIKEDSKKDLAMDAKMMKKPPKR